MLDSLLVTLSAVAAFGVAAIEFHRPVAASGVGRASVPYELGRTAPGRTALGRTALGRTALAGVAAALPALLAWGLARLTLGAGASLAAGVVLLVFGLWRLIGAIALVSTAPGDTPGARSPGGGLGAGTAARPDRGPAGAIAASSDGEPGAPTAARPGAATEQRGQVVTVALPDLLARWCSVALVVLTAALATGLAAVAIAGGAAALLALAALAIGPLRALLDRGHEGLAALLVSVLLATLGTLWAGSGVGIAWPGNGASILALFLGYLTVAVGAVEVARQWTRAMRPVSGQPLSTETTEGG